MANEKAKARKAQATASRQEQQLKMKRRAHVRRLILGAVLVGAASAVGYCVIVDRQLNASIVSASYSAGQHLSGPINYRENPPLGGPHNVVWQNCGIYTVPIHSEHAVHSLEHGAIWIKYRPDLPAADVQALQAIAADDYMLLSPYEGLPAPIVASSWNHQIQLTGAADARLQQFIRRYKNNPQTTPEFGAPCLGGTSATAGMNSLNTGGGLMR